MTAEAHLASTLRRVRTLLGRRLTNDETTMVLATLMGWHALLDAGMPPEQVAELIVAETAATTVH